MSKDFNLSKKDAVISIDINVSIKNDAKEGTANKIIDLLNKINLIADNNNTTDEDIFIKVSPATTLSHKSSN